MSYSFQIGVRYLRSKKRATVSMITLISIIGVALGVAALLAVLSITTGFEKAFRPPKRTASSFFSNIVEILPRHVGRIPGLDTDPSPCISGR